MGLRGRLEDLPLLDILQIVSFSQKTGYLWLEGGQGRGAVLFRNGRVICSYSWSTRDYLRVIEAGKYNGSRAGIVREQIETSLRELMSLREGTFQFELTDELPAVLEGVDISTYIQGPGVNPEHLLLDVATELDEDRRDTVSLIESSTRDNNNVPTHEESRETASPPLQSVDRGTVVVVDDEPMVVEVVGEGLRSAGYSVYTAPGPAEGVVLAKQRLEADEQVRLVVDLKMPTSNGRSFFGGFELVRRLNRAGARLPVLLMAEALSDKARGRALELGIRKVAFKPTLSKIDPDQYVSDLRAFSETVRRQLETMTPEDDSSVQALPNLESSPDDGSHLLEYLASMTEQLTNPRRSTDISKMVLQVAARYMDRGILFLVKDGKACGLAGFGMNSASDEESRALVRKLYIEIDSHPPFTEIVKTRKTLRPSLDEFESSLFCHIRRGAAVECTLVPMLNNGEVLTILYGDNAGSGKALGKTRGLELFMAQAGMALEIALLQRRLKSLGSKLTVDQPT